MKTYNVIQFYDIDLEDSFDTMTQSMFRLTNVSLKEAENFVDSIEKKLKRLKAIRSRHVTENPSFLKGSANKEWVKNILDEYPVEEIVLTKRFILGENNPAYQLRKQIDKTIANYKGEYGIFPSIYKNLTQY